MDALIASGLASALITVATKLAEKGVIDPALESGFEPFRKWLTGGYQSKKAEKSLQKAFTDAIKKLDSQNRDEDDLARYLTGLGLHRLQVEKSSALREQFAQAILNFTDPSSEPPENLMLALRWPRGEKEKLALLLVELRKSLGKLDEWRPLIQFADSAAQRNLLVELLEKVGRFSSAIINSEAGQVLRVEVIRQAGLTPTQMEEIEQKYRQLVADGFRMHDVQGFFQVEKKVRLPLKDIYQELGLIPLDSRKSYEEELAEILGEGELSRVNREMRQVDERVTSMIEDHPRLVIVGKPGSGKTISLKFIALMLAFGQVGVARLGLDAPYLPIYIRLSQFADALLDRPTLSLEAFLIQYLKDQFPGAPHQDEFLQAALQHGACMILLDGLDEVGDIGDRLVRGQTLRQNVLREVQRFSDQRCGETCKNRIVVTSRLEGYHRGDLAGFAEGELSPLRLPDEVEAFLSRWFTFYLHDTDPELTLQAAEAQARRTRVNPLMDSIMRADSVKLLATNPLLLTILAIIRETLNTPLPSRRVELYKIVADTLIRNWRRSQTDRDSRIHEMNISASDIYYMMAHLAFWLHEHKPGGAMELDDWRKEITTLLKDYGEPKDVAELVQEFLHHAREEVGLLTERSPHQIGFFHLTLEEYLAAVQMASQDTDFRLAMLQKYWENPRWQEVILLTAGELKERGNPAALDAYLGALLRMESEKPESFGRPAYLAGRALSDIGRGGPLRQIHRDIMKALENTAKDGDPDTDKPSLTGRIPVLMRASAADTLDELGYNIPDLFNFIPIVGQDGIPPFSISKYPITNLQYERFLKRENFENKELWCGFEKFDENSQPMNETWGDEGWKWLQNALKDEDYETQDGVLLPRYWRDARFGSSRRHAPVVGISWCEASAYCKWLLENWDDLDEGKQGLHKPQLIRLPREVEWAEAAGGDKDQKRYPWDKTKPTEKIEEILLRANVRESQINRTTPVWMYPLGESVNGVMDMAGNVWEWQANYSSGGAKRTYLGLRGGSWLGYEVNARVAFRNLNLPNLRPYNIGFRVALLPSG